MYQSTMFNRPAYFQNFLAQNNYVDGIYEAMTNDDTSEVVIRALHALKKTRNLPDIIGLRKSTNASTQCRMTGNNFYNINNFQSALICYNEALLLAPKDSREMKLAYSNRSALLFKAQAYESCSIDIEKCFTMGCPSDIIDKLKKRKEAIKTFVHRDKLNKEMMKDLTKKIVNCRMTPNSQIPCASSDITVDGSSVPTVIAATNIKIGTVVASEKAYVSFTDTSNSKFSCHYCQKQSFNLIPCEDCCYALFCDENCRIECIAEFHKYECKIIICIREICFGPMPNLMIKAVIKMRMKCKSWKEFITNSYNLGISSIESSSNKDIYDSNSDFSILKFKDDKCFKYGIFYNASFVCAALIHYLQQKTSFFPQGYDEQQQALRAFGRVMIFLSIYQIPYNIVQAHMNFGLDQSTYHTVPNFGLFSFIGKLKKKCKPNLFVVNKNNTLVLMALCNIKSGEDLTVSYLHDLFYSSEHERHSRKVTTFLYYGMVCKCSVCNGDSSQNNQQLSAFQKKKFSNFNPQKKDLNALEMVNVFSTILEALEVLQDVPFSKQYTEVFRLYRRCIMFYEFVRGENVVLDNNLMNNKSTYAKLCI